MGIFRNVVEKILDRLDPPKPDIPVAPCPSCGNDVSKHNKKFDVDRHYLRYYLCICGHASAWHWNGTGPLLVYGDQPLEIDDE